jgi:omega-amidase
MQIVACQLDIAWEDKPANFERARSLLRGASIQPGALIALPEMFATGFSMHVDTIAEAADGPTHQFLSAIAREHQACVVGGVVTRAADGRGRNDAVVFDPSGKLLVRYAKMHPFSFAGETKHYEAGDAVQLFKWQDIQVSPFVCYDLRFPEIFRQATRQGAELLVMIANWPQPRDAHWRALLVARAIENQAYVVGVNRAGSDPHVAYAGASMIVSPRGEMLALAGPEPQLLIAEIDRAPLVEYRRDFPALADMRRDLVR